jgi:hypothetical protein
MEPMAKDEKPIPPAKTPSVPPAQTHTLQPMYVVGSDEEIEAKQRARSREKAVEARRRGTQFAAEARAMIDQHPHVKASTLATWLQTRSKTKSLRGVTLPNGKPMKHPSLAKKIGRYRFRK